MLGLGLLLHVLRDHRPYVDREFFSLRCSDRTMWDQTGPYLTKLELELEVSILVQIMTG